MTDLGRRVVANLGNGFPRTHTTQAPPMVWLPNFSYRSLVLLERRPSSVLGAALQPDFW